MPVSCDRQSRQNEVQTDNQPEVNETEESIDVYANPNTFDEIEKIKIGDLAPQLIIDKWYNSESINEFEKGKVYVVEFWASWCQPCRKSIPHLNKLQAEFADDLTIIGVAASERKGPEALERLLKSKKAGISYPIAYTEDQQTFKNYMWAANNTGLPWTFIINREQKIVWWGQPFYSQFESTLRSVINGTHIPEIGETPVYANTEEMRMYWDIKEQFWAAYGQENWKDAIKLGKQLEQTDNQSFYYEVATMVEVLLIQKKNEEALALAMHLEKGILKDIPEGLYTIAYSIFENDNLSNEELNYGLHLINKVNNLTFGENPTANLLKAKFEFRTGKKEQALSILLAIVSDNEELAKEIEELVREIENSK